MSQITQCMDGGQDVTGRNTPRDYVPCENQGGIKREEAPRGQDVTGGITGITGAQGINSSDGLVSAGYMGIPKIGWIAIIGVLGYFAYTKGMFK